MDLLLLVDAHAILHRAFHALPPLTTKKGQQVNAVYGFTSMLLRFIETYKPSHVAVAFDRPKPTFRKKMYAQYQVQRPKMDDELIPQIGIVQSVLKTMEIPIFELDGYEADDVLGTLATSAKNKKMETIIVTGDRDLLQLVNGYVKVALPIKGISDTKVYHESDVFQKWGVTPNHVADYKGLVGDQSDNYPGVAGVGPKTATTLLTKFQTLEEIYEHIDQIENKSLQEKLKTQKELALLSKKLATIVTDVPIHFSLNDCKLKNLDTLNVSLLFDELEFRSLIPRLSLKSFEEKIKDTGQKTVGLKQKLVNNNTNEQIALF